MVATGKTKRPATARTIVRPRDDLFFTFFDALANVGIATVGAITTFHCFRWRDRRKDRRHLSLLAKSHVEIPFVVRCERFDTARDRVFRQRFEIGNPVRVDTPVDFKMATQHFHPVVATFSGNHFHRIMKARKPASIGQPFAQRVSVRHRNVTFAAVAIDYDRIGGGDFLFVRPTFDNRHFDVVGTRLDGFLQDFQACVVFVRSVTV